MNSTTQNTSMNNQNEDYVDKALDSVERKFGANYGINDTNKLRNTNEKITDGARNLFERATGKHVPAKISN